MSDAQVVVGRRRAQAKPSLLPMAPANEGTQVQWLQTLVGQLAEAAPVAFFALDPGGNVIAWNTTATTLFGWSADEALGRPASDTILPPPFHLDQLHREVAPSAVSGPVEGQRIVLTGRRRDGDTFSLGLEAWSTPFGDTRTFSAFAFEVIPAEEMQPALCAMGSLVESSGEAIIGTDLNGDIVTWNTAAEEMFGYCASDALGKPISMTIPTDRLEEFESWKQELLLGTPVERQESVRRRSDGSPVEVALTISLVRNSEGEITGFSTIARDITYERRMAAELDATLQDLETAVIDARESEAAGRHLLADVVHQLRAPISGIRVCAEALLKRGAPGVDDRLLSGMVRETSRAARLITALLQMARLDDRANLAPAPCDVLRLCQDEVNRARILAPHLDFFVHVGRLNPAKPELDADAVREIVANLLDNARRHAEQRVEVALKTVRGQVQITVADDGPGLAAGTEERAFERFVTLDGKGGSGLGLPLARGLAQAHGGELTYEEKIFVLRLPGDAASVGSGAEKIPRS